MKILNISKMGQATNNPVTATLIVHVLVLKV
jgi:hypothetical protein